MRHSGLPERSSVRSKGLKPRNRMRETFTSGTVGGAPGNRCFYPEILSPTELLGNCTLLDLSVNPFLQCHPLSLLELRAAYYMLILWKPLQNSRSWQDVNSPTLRISRIILRVSIVTRTISYLLVPAWHCLSKANSLSAVHAIALHRPPSSSPLLPAPLLP